MRYLLISVAACVALVVAAGASAQRSAGLQTGSSTSGYIVVLKDSTANVDARIDQLSSSLGVQTSYRYYTALKGFAASLTQAQADTLRADSSVQFVGVDGAVRAVGTGAIKAGETVPAGVRRIESAVGTQIQKKSSVKVAVIDTGVDLNHTDLKSQNGKDCINAEPAQDDNGHGTHVAGTIGARNQGTGVVGVSPNTMIVAVKVLDSGGSGSFASVICGIDWVAQNAAAKNIKVANMSLGGGGSDDGNCGNSNGDAMHKAVCTLTNTKGVSLVVAAGNSGANFAGFVPAAYNEALTVTAMADLDGKPGGTGGSCAGQTDDRFASFSNFASTSNMPDVNHTTAAPGVCVLSLRLGGGTRSDFSGTSMASPHVAGTVANCIGHKNAPGPCSGMTPAQIIAKIRADAAAKPGPYHYTGDPDHTPPAGRYYGFLVSNLGY